MLSFAAVEDLPRKFGRYQLLELLATGGMAYVYRARLQASGGVEKELVIKQVLPHLAGNRDFIDMFIDEARITLPLSHGNIVQVYEFGQVERDYYLAMEYVRGRNLETVLARLHELQEDMPVELALFIAAEVARGLDYAHRFRDPQDRHQGIIHRDVSPQNILVGFQGEVKLTDFGIAKARSRIHSTAQGVIRGKACYLSPEQAGCQKLDPRSDLFSLGIVLYEMLTGQRPFEGDNEVATLDNIRTARPRAPSVERPGLLPQVDGVVLKALSREPDRRYASAADMLAAVLRALHVQAPEFSAAHLAEWMRQRFAEEISQEIVSRSTAERLRQRLAREGRASDGMATGEMLNMATLEIRSGGNEETPGQRRQRSWGLSLVLVLVLAAGAVAFLLARPWLFSRAGSPDAGVNAGEAGPVAAGAVDGQVKPPTGDAGQTDGDVGTDEPAADNTGKAVVRASDERRPVVRYGFLDINSRPWSRVWLDGKRVPGETPIFKLRVRAGRHRLRFFNPELNIERIKTVKVPADEKIPVIVDLTAQ